LSVHGGDLFDPSKGSSPHLHAPLRAAVRWMLRAADDVVGQSRDTVRHVTDLYGVQRPVELIPLGIDRPPTLTAASRQDLGLPPDAFVTITIGRLVSRKATPQLIDMFAASQIPNAHLVIVGDGPDAPAVERRASELGIRDRVHMLGQVSDAEKYAALSVADAFITASQHEGFGLVFLEAMAFGLPVLCYDRGGQTDFLTTGETGHVVKLNDQESFVHALLELHRDREARERYGRNNRQLVEHYFIDTCAARYEHIFTAAIERRAGTPKGLTSPSS
ncbi:glycosyltransferase family 4 protein, partial [Steroidobacter sp.]|uniref:glycosyltransferase family 4 protein n=1 Tax=Steroidobacter sp. TaxID=1978227 RepID=UPI001A3BBEAB